MKRGARLAAVVLCLLCVEAAAESLMDVQDKHKSSYGKCDSMTSQMLGSRDLDGDGNDEIIQMYAFDECAGKRKAGTAVVVFHKARGKWKAAAGDTLVDSTRATTFSLVERTATDPQDVIVLKNIFEDEAPVVKMKFKQGKTKMLK